MTDESSDEEFERLARDAGVPDIPIACDPMSSDDVLVATEARVLGRDDTMDQGPRSVVCGFQVVLAQVGDAWREVMMLELVESPDMAAVLDGGPGRLIETLWWVAPFGPHDDVLLFCSVATSDHANDPQPRRFTIAIPPVPDVLSDLTSAEVFALRLVDPYDEVIPDDADEGLSWFIANDHGLWAPLLASLAGQ